MARRGERVERSSGAAPPRPSAGTSESTSDGGLLQISIEGAPGEPSVVALAGELDLSTIPKVERRLLREMGSGAGVVIDLTRLSFIDSSGIGLLIKAFRANEGEPRMHTVIARDSQVERVFHLAGIDRALPLFFDRDEALAALPHGRNARPTG